MICLRAIPDAPIDTRGWFGDGESDEVINATLCKAFADSAPMLDFAWDLDDCGEVADDDLLRLTLEVPLGNSGPCETDAIFTGSIADLVADFWADRTNELYPFIDHVPELIDGIYTAKDQARDEARGQRDARIALRVAKQLRKLADELEAHVSPAIRSASGER
jgi:hypothetical protein